MLPTMRQKVVSIYFDVSHTIGGHKAAHGEIEEHLEPYLADGWRVTTLTPLGSAGGSASTSGWLVALLERPETR